jgi:hypothetical protein
MSEDISDPGHGHSPAAWTAVIIILLAFVIGTVAFWLDAPAVVMGSAGLAVVGLLVGWGMARAGYGVGGSRYPSRDAASSDS